MSVCVCGGDSPDELTETGGDYYTPWAGSGPPAWNESTSRRLAGRSSCRKSALELGALSATRQRSMVRLELQVDFCWLDIWCWFWCLVWFGAPTISECSTTVAQTAAPPMNNSQSLYRHAIWQSCTPVKFNDRILRRCCDYCVNKICASVLVPTTLGVLRTTHTHTHKD